MQYIEGEDERDLCSAAREELVYEAEEGFLGQQGSFERLAPASGYSETVARQADGGE